MSSYRTINRALAGVAFLATFLTYAMTLQPSVPFWDCGEFSAAATWQQVPHPPGAPLWLIIGRVFQMIVPGDPGWSLNLFSAFCSAVTAGLVYLIVVRAIERWKPYREGEGIASYVGTFGGGLIAALAFTFSDTQWFNSVESEVYAGGTTLIALLMWLMMVWDSKHDKPGHERYLLLIAYICGLAIGIHLLALLVIPAVALVVYFRNYRFGWGSFLAMVAITGVAFNYLAYKGIIEYLPKMIAGTDVKIGLMLFSITIPAAMSQALGIVVLLAIAGLIVWSLKAHKPKIFLSATSLVMIILGFTTYTQILLRANAHSPMNENEPDTVAELVSYLGREQYGTANTWPRRYKPDPEFRRYQDKYGPWEPPVDQNPDGSFVFAPGTVNTGAELSFMFKWQIGHMYLRYFLWNFVGRASDVQDANWVFTNVTDASWIADPGVTQDQIRRQFIDATGYSDVFPVKFYALPLLIGLFGIYFHYKRDWKMALTFTALFLLLGVIATLQQNQQQPQPRERDYFYVGSFMVFAMWVGIGATGLASLAARRKQGDGSQAEEGEEFGAGGGLAIAALAACFIAAPLNMAVGGWKFHDRSHNWVPWDYAYNILQSCEKDAILFTAGDNDTFPVWYLQDVAGVRRDVRVINLSLANTRWYAWQLKNERPWNANKVPISYGDDILRINELEADRKRDALSTEFSPGKPVTITVPANVLSQFTGKTETASGTMSWTMRGPAAGKDQYLIRPQDKLVADIIQNNKWERPIYFAASDPPDSWAGLDDYLRPEAMAYRVLPVKQGGVRASINYEVMKQYLMNPLPNDEYHTKPHYGIKLRGLNNPDNMFLEDHRRPIIYSVIPLYQALATYELTQRRDPKAAVATLDKMGELISFERFKVPYFMLSDLANVYKQAGSPEKARKYAQMGIDAIDAMKGDYGNDPATQYYPPQQIRMLLQVSMGEYDQAIAQLEGMMKQYPQESATIRSQIDQWKVEKFLSKKDTASALAELQRLIDGYNGATDPNLSRNQEALRALQAELTGKPLAPAGGATADTSKKP
ncbi:MAG: DUF2723 domain-containing protein [Chlorobi bacterium CHB2]|nr:DUF2723 domain-containing protein [Chlorobi bacterium CHB2]